jgi:hypothetical protein
LNSYNIEVLDGNSTQQGYRQQAYSKLWVNLLNYPV